MKMGTGVWNAGAGSRVLGLTSLMIALSAAWPALAADKDALKPTDAQIKVVKELLREVPLIDGHNDVPWEYRKHGNDMNAIDLRGDTSKLKSPMATDIPRMRAGAMGGQFWSVYIPPTMSGS